MKYLVLMFALLFVLVPARADAFCFDSFHKPKVTQQAPGQIPVQIRPAGSQAKPDSFCKIVARSAAITLVVQGIVIGAKIGLGVLTGVLIL
jgi:hypothetical protein